MTFITEMNQLKKGTRKPHKCWFCGRTIPVGYRAYSGVIAEDKIKTIYECIDCRKLIEYYQKVHFDYEDPADWEIIDILIQDNNHWLTKAKWEELKKTELKKEDTK